MEKDISIIIPVYNMGNIINDTLSAFATQTDKHFKIIVVDDGSTDNGAQVIKSWQEKNVMDIEYVFQQNKGVSAARNNGIEHCVTPYLLFCDADDMMPSYSVELVRNLIPRCDVLAGLASRNMKEMNNTRNYYKRWGGVDYELKQFLFKNTSFHFCSFAYRLDILNRWNIRFTVGSKYGEDEEFTWKYLCHCKTSVSTKDVLYYYRTNPQSATQQISWLRTNGLDSMIRVYEYYKKEKHPFAKELLTFGVPREKLYILKLFAQAKRWDLYTKLIESDDYAQYDIIRLLKFPDIRIRAVALVQSISPYLCYKMLGMFS